MNELDKQVSQILIEIVTRHSERIDWLGIDYYGPKLIALITEANKTAPRIELDTEVVAEIGAIVNGKIVWLHYDDRTFADTEDAENDIEIAEERARRETIEEWEAKFTEEGARPFDDFVDEGYKSTRNLLEVRDDLRKELETKNARIKELELAAAVENREQPKGQWYFYSNYQLGWRKLTVNHSSPRAYQSLGYQVKFIPEVEEFNPIKTDVARWTARPKGQWYFKTGSDWVRIPEGLDSLYLNGAFLVKFIPESKDSR